jgi:hypothetical protein
MALDPARVEEPGRSSDAKSALNTTRIELAPVAPLELKPDWGERLVAIGTLLSVMVLGVGLWITNVFNRQQIDIALQSQITDRFTKSVEQLGQPGQSKTEVRIGGIYALERIMRDSTDDQPAVAEVLSAFIRDHANLQTPDPPKLVLSKGKDWAEYYVPDQSADIQAALSVLARRDLNADRPGFRLDLHATRLRGTNLIGAHLRNANLQNIDWDMVKLPGADLSGADLRGAKLTVADFTNANLAGANVTEAELNVLTLDGANLTETDLEETKLLNVDFSKARGMTSDQFKCAHLDINTTLPAGLVRPPNRPLEADIPECEK